MSFQLISIAFRQYIVYSPKSRLPASGRESNLRAKIDLYTKVRASKTATVFSHALWGLFVLRASIQTDVSGEQE